MGVLDLHQLEVLFPVGLLLVERLPAEADLHPAHRAVLELPRLGHVPQVLVARDRAAAERALLDGAQEGRLLAGTDAGGDEVSHAIYLSKTAAWAV